MRCRCRGCNGSIRLPVGWALAWVAQRSACGQYGQANESRTRRGEMRRAASIGWSAAEKFAADDGWAVASYIRLALPDSRVPVLLFVRALGGRPRSAPR